MVRRIGIVVVGALALASTLVAQTPPVYLETFQTYGTQADPPGWFDSSPGNAEQEAPGLYKTWPDPAGGGNVVFGKKSASDSYTHLRTRTFSVGPTGSCGACGCFAGGAHASSRFELSGRMWRGGTSTRLGVTFFSDFPGDGNGSGNGDHYFLGTDNGNGRLRLLERGEGDLSGVRDASYNWTANAWHRFRLLVQPDNGVLRFRARIWRDGQPEPTTWSIDATDDDCEVRSGWIGLWGDKPGDKYWDDLRVDGAEAPTPLELRWLEGGVELLPGTLFNRPAVPTLSLVGSPSSLTTTLNGAPFVPGTTVSADGTYGLSATATATGGGVVTAATSFTIDRTPPAFTQLAPASGALTSASAVTFTGTAAGASELTVNGAAVALGPGGSFTAGPYPLAEGANGFAFTARDAAGNEASLSVTVVRDSSPPSLTVAEPASGSVTALASILVRGTAADPNLVGVTVAGQPAALAGDLYTATVGLAEGANTLTVVALDGAGNTTTSTVSVVRDSGAPTIALRENGQPLGAGPFNRTVVPEIVVTDASPVTIQALLNGASFASGTAIEAEGSYTLSVTATDPAGNQGTASAEFTIDRTPPGVGAIEPADGAILAGPTVTLTGTLDGATGLTVNGAAVAVAGGSFTAGPYPLAEGENRFELVAVDAAGNQTPRLVRVTRDSAAPTIVVTAPAAGAVVANPSLTVTGTAADAHLAEVRVGGQLAALSGNDFTTTVTLTEGTNTLAFEARDVAGNTANASLTVTLDTLAPTLRILEGGQELASGARFNRPVTPVLEASDATAVTITATLDGAPFASGTTVSAEGAHVLAAEAVDAAGNRTAKAVDFELDATAPVLGDVTPASGTVTAETSITFTGRVRGAETLTVNGTAATLTGEDWSAGPFALAEGSQSFVLEARDAVGNATTRTVTVVRDTAAPTLAVSQPAAEVLLPSRTVTVLGSAMDPHLESVTVNGTVATLSGASFVASGVALAEGENTLTVEALDRAGNRGTLTRTLTVDTTPPAIAILDPTAGTVTPDAQLEVSGSVGDAHLDRVEVAGTRATVADGGFTVRVPLAEGETTLVARAFDRVGLSSEATVRVTRDSTAPDLAFTAPEEGARLAAATIEVTGTVEAGSTVTVAGAPAVVTGTTFVATGVPLAEGENRLVARAVDAQGNEGSRTRAVVRDSVAPQLVAAEPAAGALAVPTDGRFVLTFSEELAPPAPGAVVLRAVGGAVLTATVVVEAERLLVTPDAPLPSGAGVEVVLAATLADLAGNALGSPQSLAFGIADEAAPGAPVLVPTPPTYLCAERLVLTGTAEAGARVQVGGGIEIAETRAGADGSFRLEVALAPDAANRLTLVALDPSGNASAERGLEVFQDCEGPVVVEATLASGTFTVTFSEPVKPATLGAAVTLSGTAGAIPGTLSSPSPASVVFTPSAPLPAGALRLSVATTVTDRAANPLAFPFARLFSRDGAASFLAGTVIDQETGRPLAGVQATVLTTAGVALPEPRPEQTTGPDGGFQLPVAAGEHLVLATRPGFVPALRNPTAAEGAGVELLDPRLARLAASRTVGAAGGVVANGAASLALPGGALAAETAVSLTVLEEQALPAPLPLGWSPRGAAWVDLGGVALGGAGLASSGTLRLPVDSPDGTSLVLAQLDLVSLAWTVLATSAVEDGQVVVSVPAAGAYAALEADAGVTAPPAATVGQPLMGAAAAGELTAATLTFVPTVVLPGQRAIGTVLYTAEGDLPAGTAVTLTVSEELVLVDGTRRRDPVYRADLVVYRAPDGSLRSRFGLAPSELARLLPLASGVENVSVRRFGAALPGGGVLGTGGGTITTADGDRLTVAPGSLAEATVVTLERVPSADLALAVPAGTELVAALRLDLGGRSLGLPAAFEVTAASTPSETGLVLELVELGGQRFWRPVAELATTATGFASVALDPADLPWPGATRGAVYALVRATVPLGFVRGTVFDVGGAPLPGALVSSPEAPWLQLAGTAGRYVLPVPVGAATLTADSLATGNRGSGAAAVAAGARVDLDLALGIVAPVVVEVSPADGATGVPDSLRPTLRFSEAVERASLADGVALRLVESGETVPVDFDHRGAVVTLLPRATLLPGATYELAVGGGVRDLQGNPVAVPFASRFTTQQVLANEDVDLAKIRLIAEVETGEARVLAAPGAVPGGLVVFVENTTSLSATPSTTSAPDGSFAVSLVAQVGDRLLLHLLVPGGNERIFELGPYLAPDERTALVGTDGGRFTTADGVTVEYDAGTFAGGSFLRIVPAPVAPQPVALPEAFTALSAFDVTFGANPPQKRLRVSFPAAAGVPAGTDALLLRQVAAQGFDFWMMHEVLRQDDGALVGAATFGGEVVAAKALGAPFGCTPSISVGGRYVTGVPGNPYAYLAIPPTPNLFGLSGSNLGFLVESDLKRLLAADLLCIPTGVGRPVSIAVRGLDDGQVRGLIEWDVPNRPQEVVELPPDRFGDRTPPGPVGGSPLRFLPIELVRGAAGELADGITFEVAGSNLVVTGAPGTAAVGAGVSVLPVGTTAGASLTVSAAGDGSFSVSYPGVTGAGSYLLAVGGRIGTKEPLVLEFSEALAATVAGLEIRDGQGRRLAITPEPVDTLRTIRFLPEAGWQVGKEYELRFSPELADGAGNTWNRSLSVRFKAEASRVLDTLETISQVQDVARLGTWLFVAAEERGLAVIDVSDPANLVNVIPNDLTFPFQLEDPVRGVAVDPHGRVIVVGGGLRFQGQLRIFDPLLLDPARVAANPSVPAERNHAFRGATRISDQVNSEVDGTQLAAGFPRRVRVLSTDERTAWKVGDPAPAGLTLSPETPPAGSAPYALTVTGLGTAKLPVTLRNLSRAESFARVDAAAGTGAFSLTLQVVQGDALELLRNQASIAYVAVIGGGLTTVDVNATYTDEANSPFDPLTSHVLGWKLEDPALDLCPEGGGTENLALTTALELFADAGNAVPLALPILVGTNGLAVESADPADVADLVGLTDACLDFADTGVAAGMTAVPAYRFDLDGDGSLEASEERDYLLVVHSKAGVLVYDVTVRSELRLVGRLRLPGSGVNVTVDRLRRRLYVAGSAQGLYVLDFDRKPDLALLDDNGDGEDDRVLERITLPGPNTSAAPLVIPELGVAFVGGVGQPLTSLAVAPPLLVGVRPKPNAEGRFEPVDETEPYGVPAAEPEAGAEAVPGAFRVLAALPGVTSETVRLDLEAQGPGGLRLDELGLGDLPQGPRVALEGGDGLLFRRLDPTPLGNGSYLYLSEEVVALADPRAARSYTRTAAEDDACVRCDPAADGVSATARELLAGDALAVRFPEPLRTQLAQVYTSAQLSEGELRLPSTRWEITPSLEQEPAQSADYGSGDVAPGTLMATGEMTQSAVDLVLRGRGFDFAFARTYRSGTVGPSPLGLGWEFGYRQRLRELPNGDVEHYDGRGRRELWEKRTGEGAGYEAPVGVFATLSQTSAGWVLVHPDRTQVRFDRFGRLASVVDALKSSPETGNEMRFFYDARSRLVRVQDALERDFHLAYDEDGLLTSVTDPEGRLVRFEYELGRLVAVKSPVVSLGDGPEVPLVTRYGYQEAGPDWVAQLTTGANLASVTDPKGQEWLQLTYTDADGDGRAEEVTSQRWGAGTVALAYAGNETTVTDRRGHVCTYQHNDTGQRVRFEDAVGAATLYEHDGEGLLTSVTLPLGGQITYEYGSELVRRSRGNVTRLTQTADARGGNGSPAALVTAITYEPTHNLPIEVVDPRGTRTTITRATNGLPLTVTEAAGTAEARTTRFEHNAFGQVARVTNANGHATTFKYFGEGAEKGYLHEQVVAAGALNLRTTYEVDARGNVTAVLDPRGVEHTFTWNALDWPLVQTLAAQGGGGAPAIGATTAFVYDRNGNVEETKLPGFGAQGQSSSVFAEYGVLDEVLRVRREIGGGAESVERYEYDPNLNVTKILGDLGRELQLAYDPRNLLASTERLVAPPAAEGEAPTVITESHAYDAEGQRTATTDGRGQTWPVERDGYGRVKVTRNPLGHARELRYDANGNPTETRARDASELLLAKTTVTYDRLDRPTQTAEHLLDASGGTLSEVTSAVAYDPVGNVRTTTDPLGRVTTHDYDAAERAVATTDAAGNRVDLELDANGNVVRSTSTEILAEGGATTRVEFASWDALNRLSGVTDALNNQQLAILDPRGNVLEEIDAQGFVTRHFYDALGRRTRTDFPPTASNAPVYLLYEHDLASRLTGYTDAKNQKTTTVYDLADRPVRVTYPDATAVTRTWDANGNLVAWTDANGNRVEQVFDVANRLLTRQATLGSGVVGPTLETYQLDGLDRLVRAQSGSVVTELAWDSLSRLTAETTNGKRVAYQLDAVGNPTRLDYPSGLQLVQTFDVLNRPATVGSAAAFGYEGRGLKSRVSYAGGVQSRWSYDAARRPTGRSTTFPPGAVATPAGPTRPWQPNVIQEAMAWSPRGERTGVVGSLGLEGGFRASYDPAGRLTGRSTLQGKLQLPLPNLPPLAPSALESTVYDTSPAQHLAERKTKSTLRPLEAVTGLPEDGTGRNRPGAVAAPGGVGSMALGWDGNGNLTVKGDLRLSYDFRNRLREVRDTASGETLASFDYDAFNRRVTKQSFGRTTETVWSGWRALEERQGGQLRFRKIYGLGLDELVRVESDSDLNGTLETAYLPLYDELSNLAALTDTSGKPIVRYEHGAFGEERRVAVDLERPKAVQITTRGRDTIVVEMSEEISRTELERALAAGGVVLSRTAITGTSAAKAAKSSIALSATPASEEGQSPRQRWVFTLAEPANPGEEVELAFDTGALVDGFLNTPEAITRIRFAWPSATERTVVQDLTPPEIRQVGLIGGVLEVVLSEEPNLAAAATALTLNGQPVAWQLSEDGYALRTPQPLTPGDHELQLTTNPLDLAGNGLVAADTLPFTWNGTTQLETLLTGTKRAEKSLIDDVAALNVGFQGQPFDPETGLYYFRNRYYDPELGRFITADPLGYVDGPSLYAFAGGDPVNGRDPLGSKVGAWAPDCDGLGELGCAPEPSDSPDPWSLNPYWTGHALATTYDSLQRQRYLGAIKAASLEAIADVEAASTASDLSRAMARARRAFEERNVIRAAAQRRLSPGGRALSRALDQQRTWEQVLVKYRKGNPFETAREVALAAGRSSRDLRLFTKFGRVAGPLGAGFGLGLSAGAVRSAAPDQRWLVATEEAGGLLGGGVGGAVGTAAGAQLVVSGAGVLGLSSPPGLVVLGAGLVVGAVGAYFGSEVGRDGAGLLGSAFTASRSRSVILDSLPSEAPESEPEV